MKYKKNISNNNIKKTYQMKKLFILFLVAFAFTTNAQVNVSSTDMPVPADTIYYTTHQGLLPVPVTNTGQNYSWDYSTLSGTVQRLDSFIAVTDAPFFYVATFNNPLDQLHKATVSLKTTPPATGGGFSPITFQDFYAFYRNKTSEFAQVGVGATISINGSSPAPVPAKYSALDIIYKFPLSFGNEDSSVSSYKFDLGTSGYFSEKRKRHNYVDGYGELKTPFGAYQTMRVKSISEIEDTIFFNSFPLKFKRYETVYSWLAPGFHEPLLKITQTSFNSPTGNPSVQTEYFDFKKLATSLNLLNAKSSQVYVSDSFIYCSEALKNSHFYLFNLEGKLIKSSNFDNNAFSVAEINESVVFYLIPEKNISGKLYLKR